MGLGNVITMNYVMSSGMDVKKQGLFWEKDDEPLAVMVLAAREKDKDKAEYKRSPRFSIPKR